MKTNDKPSERDQTIRENEQTAENDCGNENKEQTKARQFEKQ